MYIIHLSIDRDSVYKTAGTEPEPGSDVMLPKFEKTKNKSISQVGKIVVNANVSKEVCTWWLQGC